MKLFPQFVERPHRLVWTGRSLGLNAIHSWTIVADGEGSRVRTEESLSGWWLRPFAASIRDRSAESVERWLEALARRAPQEIEGCD